MVKNLPDGMKALGGMGNGVFEISEDLVGFQLYNVTRDEQLANSDVMVSVDGVERVMKVGDIVTLNPGESITLPDHVYHKFWAAEGRVLAGEVSLVNDDQADNRFCDAPGRFPAIKEDEPPLYLLCTDYPRCYRPHG